MTRRSLLRRALGQVSLALLVLLGGCRGDALPHQPTSGPLASGDHDRSLEFAGLERTYILHVPPGIAPGRPRPLVISFHGGGGHAQNQQQYSGLDRVADRERFYTLYPDGTGGVGRRLLTWNAGSCCGPAMRKNVDDVGFVRALVDEVARLVPVDRTRIYATGLSNGAMMSHRMAADAPDLVAAIAPVAGANDVHPRAGARAVPVMHIHSVDDPRALYTGGLGPPFPFTKTRSMHTPVEELMRRWVEHDGCPKTAHTDPTRHGAAGSPDASHSATRISWGPCRDGSEVVLWRLTGSGHVWPGGERDFLVRLLGPGTRVIDANEEMWRFFSRFSLGKTSAPPLAGEPMQLFTRDKLRSVGLVPWNGTAVTRSEPPHVLELGRKTAPALVIPGCSRVVEVATAARPGALCRDAADAWTLMLREGSDWRAVPTPAKGQRAPVFAGGPEGFALLEDGRLHSYASSWVSRDVDPVPDPFPKGTTRALVHQGRLFVGYDRGEWGGRLFSIALGAGGWRNEGDERERFHSPIRDLAVDPRGTLWAVEGLSHLGIHHGALYRNDGDSWRRVAASELTGSDPKGTSGGDWNLPGTSFDAIAFDERATPYLLTGSLGVVRHDSAGWSRVSKEWNEFQYVSGLAILGGVGVVSSYDSGLLLCDLASGKLEPVRFE